MRHWCVWLCVMTGILAAVGYAAAQEPAMESHWEGALSLRGSEMPVRIHVYPSGDTLTATLDLPDMLMAWEPVPISRTADGIAVEFPFGIATLSITIEADRAEARRAVGDDPMVLALARISPAAYQFEDVRFRAGDVTLVGRMVIPEGKGPHPAVVLLHGSGRKGMVTWEYRSWAEFFVRQGVAVLYYDKRGVGQSGGSYPVDLWQLADDGLAALQYLRTRNDIDTSRLGLKGSSQGAWLAEQVAAADSAVAFLVLTSAAAGTPGDQEMQSVEYGMRSEGRSEEEIDNALAYYGLYFYVAHTGKAWSALEEAIGQAQGDNEWGHYVDQPRSLDDLAWWHNNHDFNTHAAIRSLRIPTILCYGEADTVTPPAENAYKLKDLFADPDNVELLILPGADHRIELPMGRDHAGLWHWPRIAPALLPAISNFLATHLPD